MFFVVSHIFQFITRLFLMTRFGWPENFGEMLGEKFNGGSGSAKVGHLACCLEQHKDGGAHYHASLKLTGAKKWLRVMGSIMREHTITVNVSDSHNYYIAAYKYVYKNDDQVGHSAGDPDLTDVGAKRTKNSSQSYRQSRERVHEPDETDAPAASKTKEAKPPKLTNMEVSDFLINPIQAGGGAHCAPLQVFSLLC